MFMKENKGFTLIELIIVIVILGILSVIALPKFIDLQRDAKIATLQGYAGAIKSANDLIHGAWVIAGGYQINNKPDNGNYDLFKFENNKLLYCANVDGGIKTLTGKCKETDGKNMMILQNGYIGIEQYSKDSGNRFQTHAMLEAIGKTDDDVREYNYDDFSNDTECSPQNNEEFCYYASNNKGKQPRYAGYFMLNGYKPSDKCYFEYIPPREDNVRPIYNVVTDGC